PPTGGPRCRRAPASWPTATRPTRTSSAATRPPPCSPPCPPPAVCGSGCSTMPDLTADYLAMRREVGAVWLPRDFVRVTGPEAESFLQGQLSQDLAGMEPGTARLSFLLQPQGKVDALVRVTWMSDDELVLDVDSGWGEAVVARLERFKLRTKADIERVEWRCLALRGPRAHEMAEGHPRLVNDWPGLSGVDQVGPERVVRVPAGVRVCDIQAYEAVRIEAGV